MTSDIRKTHKLSADGKSLVPKAKLLNLCAEMKKKASTRVRVKKGFTGRKPDAFRV